MMDNKLYKTFEEYLVDGFYSKALSSLSPDNLKQLEKIIKLYQKTGIIPDHKKGDSQNTTITIICAQFICPSFRRVSKNWKFDITPEHRKERTKKSYFEWRRKVFERDGFTCAICKKVGGRLNAHHIKRFSKYKSLRTDLNNGITLCEKCHRELHRKEGR